MKLIVDCALSHSLLALPADSALSALLAVAQVRQLEMPLEAVLCEQYGLSPLPDYPIAAIAADADGLQVGQAYWLRADPVHLLLQRDSFSLSEPVPLVVEQAHAEIIMADLNRHFNAQGMHFMLGNSGAWYLRLDKQPQVQTTLPAVALDRNIYQFMPAGADASQWLAFMNEVQMLLHDHHVNDARESLQQPAINSVWFSGGGVLPTPAQHTDTNQLLMADSPLYHGLAHFVGAIIMPADMPWAELLAQQCKELRLLMPVQHVADDKLFKRLLDALKAKKIQQLIVNLGCYDKTLIVSLTPSDRFKFWRKRKALASYL